MGLHIITGPDWEDDSLNQINDEAVDYSIEKYNIETGWAILPGHEDAIVKGIMLTNPVVSVDTPED